MTHRLTAATKSRQADLLDLVLRMSPSQSASSRDLGLIIAVESGVDKQRVADVATALFLQLKVFHDPEPDFDSWYKELKQEYTVLNSCRILR